MMDKKRIRKTLNDVVERYLLGDVDVVSVLTIFGFVHN